MNNKKRAESKCVLSFHKATPKTVSCCDSSSLMLNNPSSSLKIEWLDSKSAAQHLCISVPFLRNLVSTGQIPFYKFGRLNRFRKDELDALLLKNKRGV